MKSEELDYKLLARYLAGECTVREQKRIEEWVQEHPQNKKRLKEFKRIYNTSGKGSTQSLSDAESEWDTLRQRLKDDETARQTSDAVANPAFRTSSLHSATHKVMRVAAIFLVAGLVGVFAYQNWYQPEPEDPEPTLREISTANAQRANLTLGDGTTVMLNAGSSVKFPDHFQGDLREVYLDGEAYFNVVSNAEKPFIVHTRGSVVRVLGTEFAIRSYEEDQQVRVVVREGKVSFGAEELPAENNMMLEASELGKYTLGTQKIETAHVTDMDLYMSWRKGYLKFREEPMQNVAKELERRYGVEVSFKDSEIKEKLLTAFLKSRSIKNVLEVVATSLDLDYRLQEDHVSFFNE